MALEKITEAQMNATGVCAAPDILNGTPAENKAVFDRMVRNLVAPAYNACVDAVNELQNVETGVVAAEAERAEAEEARKEAETAREDKETGYVAQAKENALVAYYEAKVAQYGRLEFSRNGQTITLSGGSYDNIEHKATKDGLPDKAYSLEQGRKYSVWVYRSDVPAADTKTIVYAGNTVEVYGVEIRGSISYISDKWSFYIKNTLDTTAQIKITAENNDAFPAAETSANNAADSETAAKQYAERAEYAGTYVLGKTQEAEDYANAAIDASHLAENHANRAEAARDSIVLDEEKMAEAKESAAASAQEAMSFARQAENSAADAMNAESSAKGHAETARASAVQASDNANWAAASASQASGSAGEASTAARQAQQIRDSLQMDYNFFNQAIQQTETNANRASYSEESARQFADEAAFQNSNAAISATRAGEAADRAEAAADRAESAGGGSTDAVLYTPQTLTNEQKSQARENIGAVPEVFVAVYGETTFNDIVEAAEAGKVVVYNASGNWRYLHTAMRGNKAVFSEVDGESRIIGATIVTPDNRWVYTNSSVVTSGELKAEGFVSYNPQTLTDEQKAQARENIGAATVAEVLAALPVYAGEVEDA